MGIIVNTTNWLLSPITNSNFYLKRNVIVDNSNKIQILYSTKYKDSSTVTEIDLGDATLGLDKSFYKEILYDKDTEMKNAVSSVRKSIENKNKLIQKPKFYFNKIYLRDTYDTQIAHCVIRREISIYYELLSCFEFFSCKQLGTKIFLLNGYNNNNVNKNLSEIVNYIISMYIEKNDFDPNIFSRLSKVNIIES
jgi:hypothetical protein